MEWEWPAALRSKGDNVLDSLCLVSKCRELEESFGTHFTDKMLCKGIYQIKMREMKKTITPLDKGKRDLSYAKERLSRLQCWQDTEVG